MQLRIVAVLIPILRGSTVGSRVPATQLHLSYSKSRQGVLTISVSPSDSYMMGLIVYVQKRVDQGVYNI